ncbi:MAG: AI-2E family transporter [Lachnospiraceae bacterium]|nr:AI-2E family transporter [Lachnospiraceae bacterium]
MANNKTENNNINDSVNSNTPDNPRRKKRIDTESKYFTISYYVVFVVLISIVAYRFIIHWESTLKTLSRIAQVCMPYFIGFLLAYLLNPMVNFLYDRLFKGVFKIKKSKVNWALSITTSYVIVLGVVVVCISFIIPQLINSISDLIGQLPDIVNRVADWLNEIVKDNEHIAQNSVNEFTDENLPNLQEKLTEQLADLIPAVYGVGVSFVKFIINLFIALMVSIYLIIDKRRIKKYLAKFTYAIMSKEHAESFFVIVGDCNKICKNFFIGKTIDSLIIGTLCLIAMSIIGLPYAVLISVIVGITNMIPYFGPYIGAIPGVIILLIDKPSHGIAFLILIIILQAFDGCILGPKILGNSTGLRPIVILFAISCGGALAGPLGMFLGVPAFGIISYLIDKYVSYKLKKKNMSYLVKD